MAYTKTKDIIRKSAIGLLVLLVVIQFIRPAKNINTAPQPQDINTVYPMPDNVYHILQVACYDCHSNNTRYPWYNNIQPVTWWLNDHVQEGKRELNFSEFGAYATKRKVRKLKEIVNQVEQNEMPLNSYTWIHKDAILSASDKQLLVDWAKGLSQTIIVQTGFKDTATARKR